MTASLHFGDNLEWLKRQPAASVDLCYIDPPFNSKADYNVIVGGAQIEAFSDTWTWGIDDEKAWARVVERGNHVASWAKGMRDIIGPCGMFSYLIFMAERLIEIKRVLKPTGSIYVHCDQAANFQLRLLMNAVFGPDNFRNAITWKRYAAHSLAIEAFDAISDTMLYYSAGGEFHPQYESLTEHDIRKRFPHVEPETGRHFQHVALEQSANRSSQGEKRVIDGRTVTTNLGWRWSQETFDERISVNPRLIYWTDTGRPRYKVYMDEYAGKPLGDIWMDIAYLSAGDSERVGYPTQKPLALVERIILASSNPGDMVMDCFLGSGTTAVAAVRNGRNFMGCDITYQAIEIAEKRLAELEPKPEVVTTGHPATMEDVRALAAMGIQGKLGFQAWALDMVGGNPSGEWVAKAGADRGVDGKIVFVLKDGSTYTTIVQVKGGGTGRPDLQKLMGVVASNEAQRGLFLMLEEPSQDMIQVAAGYGLNGFGEAKCIILSAQDLLDGKQPPDIRALDGREHA